MPHKDPVTPELRRYVLNRDGGCMAQWLGAPTGCRDTGGYPLPMLSLDLELDHVRDQPMIGKRAPSDPIHLVALCHHHHQGGWATRNRPLLRSYLVAVEIRGLTALNAAREVLRANQRATGEPQT